MEKASEPLRFQEFTREDSFFPGGIASWWRCDEVGFSACESIVDGVFQVDGFAGKRLVVMGDTLRVVLNMLQYIHNKQAWPIRTIDKRSTKPELGDLTGRTIPDYQPEPEWVPEPVEQAIEVPEKVEAAQGPLLEPEKVPAKPKQPRTKPKAKARPKARAKATPEPAEEAQVALF